MKNEELKEIRQYFALILGRLNYIDEKVKETMKITHEEISKLVEIAKSQDEKLKKFANLNAENPEEVQKLQAEVATLRSETEFLNDDDLNNEIEKLIANAGQNLNQDNSGNQDQPVADLPPSVGNVPPTENTDTSDATTPVIDPTTGNVVDPATGNVVDPATGNDVNNPVTDNSDVTINDQSPNADHPSDETLPDGSTISSDKVRTFPDGTKIDRNGNRIAPPS